MIIVIENGSQYTDIIVRRVRELGVWCEKVDTLPSTLDHVEGIIIGGSDQEAGTSSLTDKQIWSASCPILGICYGMQEMVEWYGGKVKKGYGSEFGPIEPWIDTSGTLFSRLENVGRKGFWASHNDSVVKLPYGFKVIGGSDQCEIEAIENKELERYGVQFHPEVSGEEGKKVLHSFLYEICGCVKEWVPINVLDKVRRETRALVRDTDQVMLGLSGGVDSSTLAVLLHSILGDRLTCVFVDQGFMRENEPEELVEMFDTLGIEVHHVKCRAMFLNALEGITDGEEKRKIIGKVFVDVFGQVKQRLERNEGRTFTHLVQGTIKSDVVESTKIKSHHNVGGLPQQLGFPGLLEPFKDYYKDEVRAIATALGLPDQITNRPPFPGPGLAIRVDGIITKSKLRTLRKADLIIREETLGLGYWQVFGVLLDTEAVGVKGDQRAVGHSIVIRAVHSQDGMTADFAEIPYSILRRISSRITNELADVTRVLYDITSKPPGCIEFW